MTLLRPELSLNRSQQLCRTCSPRLTKPWPTAGLQRQLFTWKERLSRPSAGLTILPWMTAVWVSLTPILSNFLVSLSLSLTLPHILSAVPVAKLQTRHLCTCCFLLYSAFHNTLPATLVLACLLCILDIVLHVYNRAGGCSKNHWFPKV